MQKGTSAPIAILIWPFSVKKDTPSAYPTFLIAQELADLLKADVDIINLNEASTVFKAQIFSSGILIYSEDDTFFMNSACWH